MLWNQVAVDRGASTLPIQMRLFILLSLRLFWCWPANGCISAAKGAASGNEQLVQEIPKALVKISQTKEKMRDAVLLLAQTGINFEAVGRGYGQEVILYHVTSRGQGKSSCFLGEAIPGESWWGH